MRGLIVFVILIVNLLFQSTWFEYIEILNVKPNTALVFVVCYAILRGDVEGAIVGFFAGLLQDAYFGTYLGLHAMLCMLTGYYCGKPFKNFYRESYLQPFVLVTLSCLAYEFAFYFSTFLFHGKIDVFYYMQKIIIPETIYTLITAIPIYQVIYIINSNIEYHEKSRRKLF